MSLGRGSGFPLRWLALFLLAGIAAFHFSVQTAHAQSGSPLAYIYRGADGTCYSGGIHPDNGHDGQWGLRDFIQSDSNLICTATGPGQAGIRIDVSGGNGGNGKHTDYEYSHWGGNGAGGRNIDYGLSKSVVTSASRGVDLHSGGGNGGLYGNANGPDGGYGIGGDGHLARATLTDTTVSGIGFGVAAQSLGGTGSDSALPAGFGGERDSGRGGNAGEATVSLLGMTSVTVHGPGPDTVSAGVGMLSMGGNGGTAQHIGDFGGHSNAGRGGDASTVTFTSSAGSSVVSQGDGVYGVVARSLGGNASTNNYADTRAGDGGNAGPVIIANGGTISTLGSRSIGIFALSQGGQGGNGGDGTWARGHPGGAGGAPGAITITNTGAIKTGSSDTVGAKGIVANVLGGEGGEGGGGGSFGRGGDGGPGAQADQAISITNAGDIATVGNDAAAVLASSAGGGGGLAETTNGIMAVGGGRGGAGGAGGRIIMDNTGGIATLGDNSAAVSLQSIGGGGGFGGDANATGVITSIAIGGNGGAGGNGGELRFSSNGSIYTQAGNSSGVVLQSVGGGGGSAGSASAVGVGVGLNITLSNGGRGGGGGSGSSVSFTQTSPGIIGTLGAHSDGVLAQSIGGGGGNGGLANSRTVTIAPPTGDNPSGAVTLAISNGGSGQGGGVGGMVTLVNGGFVSTAAEQSKGLIAQSIGGGGGNGGGVLAPVKLSTIGSSLISLQFSLRHGGQGGQGGNGGQVKADNSGTGSVTTLGTGSVGILAQSIGAGGGNGGIVQTHDAGSFNDILGSASDLPDLLDKVALWLESGPELELSKAIDLSVGVTTGGSGGAGGDAAAFNVRNDGLIKTAGDHAPGIVAQSIGGGGGNAGMIDSSGISSLFSSINALIHAAAPISRGAFLLLPQIAITHQTGGSGGAAGSGGGSSSDPSTVLNTGTIATLGDGSMGILAQSIGGGGGRSVASGQDLENAVEQAAGSKSGEIIDKITYVIELLDTGLRSAFTSAINVNDGGVDGSSGIGGVVVVDASASTSRISTQGYQAPGILAQSVGGGGGVSSVSQPMFLLSHFDPTMKLGATGTQTGGGTTSTGGSVTVTHGGVITTHASSSAGIMAQSVGGSGGLGVLSLHNGSLAPVEHTATLNLTLGGEFKWVPPGFGFAQVSGGAVSASNNGGIATRGSLSPGIFAQSVGGGGGAAIVSSSASLESTDILLGSSGGEDGVEAPPSAGDGGSVAVANPGGSIVTDGALSFGVLAQSVGGGGGYAAVDDSTAPAANAANITFGSTSQMSATGGMVTVTQDANGSISTSGVNAHGIVAQSVGGGGGIAGLTTQPNLTTLRQLGAAAAGGDGGAINLSISGTVATSGAGAIGILAQSIGGGGGLTGDQASAHYTTSLIQGAGLTAGDGNGGAIDVSVGAGGSVQTTGANAPAILAMSIGGGGVFKDGTLYQYGTPDNHLANGGPISIDIGQAAKVVASGADTPALVAVSNGANGGGRSITIGLASKALLGADLASGTAILALSPLSSTTIANAGVIQAKTAIDAPGRTAVTNTGTVAGDVLMGSGSVFNNEAGGSLYSGLQFQGDLNNGGVLNPGGPGAYLTTRIAGTLNNTGVYRPDLGFSNHNSDFVSVSGASVFAGTVRPVLHNPVKNIWLGIAHFDIPQTSVPVAESDSPLFRYMLKNNGPQAWRDPLISVDADFTPSVFALSADRANITRSLQELWNRGDASTGLAFDKFTGVQTQDQYRDALNSIAHDGQFARASNQMQASYASMNRMMSCPGFVGESTMLREGDCTWARLDANWIVRDTTADDEGYRVRQKTVTIGAQREISHNWFLGGALGYAYGETTSSSSVSNYSDTFSGGLALKYNRAPWQAAVAVYGGVEQSRMSRSTLDGVAKSTPKSFFLAGRLRLAYEVSRQSWYLRPYVDFDVSHIRQNGYQEEGSGLFDLKVHGNDTTSYMVSPMLEIGGRRNLASGSTLRAYLVGGASFLNGGDVVTTMELGSLGSKPFSLRSGMPRTYANLSAGLEYVTPKGFELKTEYSLRVNGQYRDQSFTLRTAYHF
ncbi:MAG: autotransporter outer membrane beta-barrel domain-containing protein [Castellaniella sp.]|uniref:autotransporter outer membrane beta-barrel domain-containing protein n=1 Tax=Castellaniella sp. TaxID=1955812 RepID=UPI003A854A42